MKHLRIDHMQTVHRTETPTGEVIRHDGKRDPVMGCQTIHWAQDHELVANMRTLGTMLIDDPRGPILGRYWHEWRTGKITTTRPNRLVPDDDGDETNGIIPA